MNILIVDDSETVRAVLEKTLRLAQVPLDRVYHAGNGQEALDLVASIDVDLIFADINMPVMNGVEMLQRLAATNLLVAIPVVVISTDGSQSRLASLQELGIAGYVRKPFRPEQIRDVVAQIRGGGHAS